MTIEQIIEELDDRLDHAIYAGLDEITFKAERVLFYRETLKRFTAPPPPKVQEKKLETWDDDTWPILPTGED
jgi:hypothetical protein